MHQSQHRRAFFFFTPVFCFSDGGLGGPLHHLYAYAYVGLDYRAFVNQLVSDPGAVMEPESYYKTLYLPSVLSF